MTSPLGAEKSALRSLKIALRRNVPQQVAEAAAGQAARHAMALLGKVGGRTIAVYMPVRGELSPLPLVEKVREGGGAVALPHVVSDTAPMSFRLWQEGDPLEKGFGGIPGPGASASEVIPDVVVVPLAVFDRRGFRIGYGKGHYDRTLGPLVREERPLTVGYAFALQETEEVPREDHDVPLDAVITENGIIRCNLSREGF